MLLCCILFSVFFVSCSEKNEIGSMYEHSDTLLIKESLLNSKCRVRSISNNTYFQGYDKYENRITLIDVASSKEIFSVNPKIDYQNDSAGRLIQFDVYKIDSVFIITENNIFIINADGGIIYRKNLTEPVIDDNGYEY